MDRRLLVLATGMFALGTDSYVVAGVLPQVARTYSVSIGAAGQMTTVYALTFALLAPTIAALAAEVPRKTMLYGGLLLFLLANLATAFAPTFAIALIMRALAGLGAAMFSPTATGAASTIVPPERRGFALAVVMAGMSAATALGSPLGAVIGGLGSWRWTMAFVAALAGASFAGASFAGVVAFLSDIPLTPRVSLARRIAPLADYRVGVTLATTLIAMAGTFTTYTYFSVVFDRAIGGNAAMLGGLLLLWGVGGTIANLVTGRLIDTVGSRTVILTCLSGSILNFALMSWTSASIWTAAPAVLLWGACGWGILVPQQHRLVTINPSIATVLLGLNTAGTYFGVTIAGIIGALSLKSIGAHQLGLISMLLIATAVVVTEFATRSVRPQAIEPQTCSA